MSAQELTVIGKQEPGRTAYPRETGLKSGNKYNCPHGLSDISPQETDLCAYKANFQSFECGSRGLPKARQRDWAAIVLMPIMVETVIARIPI